MSVPQAPAEDLEIFRVIEQEKCEHCGDQEYLIAGPDGYADGLTFDDEDDAWDHAATMNRGATVALRQPHRMIRRLLDFLPHLEPADVDSAEPDVLADLVVNAVETMAGEVERLKAIASCFGCHAAGRAEGYAAALVDVRAELWAEIDPFESTEPDDIFQRSMEQMREILDRIAPE